MKRILKAVQEALLVLLALLVIGGAVVEALRMWREHQLRELDRTTSNIGDDIRYYQSLKQPTQQWVVIVN